MSCGATLGDSGRLVCTNPVAHEPHRGCVYMASSVSDAHDASEQAAEEARG